MGKKKGYAFLYVLCVSVLMSALLMGVLTLSLSAKKSTKSLEDTYRLSSMSESGVEKGISCLKQEISNNTNVFSDSTTPLKCDQFSFGDSGIKCTVKFTDDNSDASNPVVVIDSTAETLKGKKKEDIVYLKKNNISNIYYNMLFNNVITTLGKKDETLDEYKTAFDMGNGVNEMSLDGNMYLQGNIVNFKPKATDLADNSNDDPDVKYYDYSDSLGNIKIKADFPKPDTIAATYHSGFVYANCNTLNIPSVTTGPLVNLFKPDKLFGNTITPIDDSVKSEVGSYVANEYPILNVVTNKDDTPLVSDSFIFDITDLAYNTNFKEYLILPSDANGNLVTILIKKIDKTKTTAFDFTHFVQYAKAYIYDNFPVIKNAPDADKDAKFKALYQLYVVDGDVDFSIRWHWTLPLTIDTSVDYSNTILYSTGKVHIYQGSWLNIENLSLLNSSIMARSIIIDQLPNRPAFYKINWVFFIPIIDYSYLTKTFERAVTLHGIKQLGADIGADGYSPFNQKNRDAVNNFLNVHLTGYSKYYTFTIDKWVEK